MYKSEEGPSPENRAFYIEVDDLDAYGERIQAAGGRIVADKVSIPGLGKLILFEDPENPV
jgi:predicted enzyme related to lactoylglutathione lyase